MTSSASAASSRSPRPSTAAPRPAMPRIERVVVRDDVGPAPGGDDRDLEQLGEAEQLGRGPGPEDAGTGQDDRPFGRGQQLDDRPDLLVRGGTPAWRIVRCRRGILGHRSRRAGPRGGTGGPGPAGRRAPGGLASAIASAISTAECGSAAHLARPPSVATWSISWNASRPERPRSTWPTSDEHRCRVLAGGVDPDGRGSRRRRRGSPRHDRRPAGQLAVGLGHERGGALVAGRDDPDPGALEGIEEAEERLARDGERVPDAGGAEGVGDEPADGARARLRRLARARPLAVPWLASRRRLRFGLGGRAASVDGLAARARRQSRRRGSGPRRLGVDRRCVPSAVSRPLGRLGVAPSNRARARCSGAGSRLGW